MFKNFFYLFYYLEFFYVIFQKFSSNFTLTFSLFFGKLPTMAVYPIKRIYSRQIPAKVEIIYG